MTEEAISMNRSTYNKVLAVLVVVIIAASFMGGYIMGGAGKTAGQSVAQQTQQAQQPTQQASRVSLQIPSYAVSQGSDSAKVNFIEFGDYQCPFCERFFSQSEPQVIDNYVTTNKAKFYFLDFAFLGPDSTTLSEGAWCANEQGKYYEYHDYIYSHQGQESSGWGTPDKVKAIAANIPGLNVQQFGTCLDSGKYASRVTELTQLGQKSGVSGTPSFLIGNADKGYTLVVGAQPYSVIKAAIDQELAG